MATTTTAACDVVIGASVDDDLVIISRVLMRNLGMLMLCAAILFFAGVLILQLVRSIRSAVRTHARLTKQTESPITISAAKDAGSELLDGDITNLLSGYANSDDYRPVPVVDTQLLNDLPSERDAVKERIKELKSVYSDYNKEITTYSRDVLKKEPGNDIVDERILSKENDM